MRGHGNSSNGPVLRIKHEPPLTHLTSSAQLDRRTRRSLHRRDPRIRLAQGPGQKLREVLHPHPVDVRVSFSRARVAAIAWFCTEHPGGQELLDVVIVEAEEVGEHCGVVGTEVLDTAAGPQSLPVMRSADRLTVTVSLPQPTSTYACRSSAQSESRVSAVLTSRPTGSRATFDRMSSNASKLSNVAAHSLMKVRQSSMLAERAALVAKRACRADRAGSPASRRKRTRPTGYRESRPTSGLRRRAGRPQPFRDGTGCSRSRARR